MSEYGRGEHPNSRANLNPVPFEPGHDPRRSRGGPPSFARRVLSELNRLANVARPADDGESDPDAEQRARFDVGKLRKIIADDGADHAARAAAVWLLAVTDPKWDKIDRQPRALAALRELMDRYVGKPVVTVEVTHHQSLEEAQADLIAVFRADRLLLLSILDRLADNIPGIRAEIIERLEATGTVLALPSPAANGADVSAAIASGVAIANIAGGRQTTSDDGAG